MSIQIPVFPDITLEPAGDHTEMSPDRNMFKASVPLVAETVFVPFSREEWDAFPKEEQRLQTELALARRTSAE